MPLAAVAGIGAIGSIAGGIIGSNAAGKAADTQAAAANNAAQLERQNAVDALNFQKQQYNNSLQMLNPYLQRGYQGLGLLSEGLGLPGANAQGFTLPASTPSTGANLNGIGGIGSLADLRSRLQLGNNGGPQPFQATSATAPAGGAFGFNGTNLLSDGSAAPKPGQSFGFNGVNPVSGLPGTAPTSGGSILPAGQVGNGGMAFNGGPEVVPRAAAGTTDGQTAGGTDASGNPNISFGSLLKPFGQTFQAPTDVTEQNDPGYQFRLKQGQQALQNSAAARGGLMTGGTAKALSDYNQNAASNEYGNVYNRALQTYGTNYNQYVNDQTNQFNKLAAISGVGQTSANDLSLAGLNTGNSVANTLLTSGGQIGQQLNNAGAATASGYIGGANAINGAIGGVSNNLSTLALLQALQKQGSGIPSGGNGVF